MSQLVIAERDGPILALRLNRPERHNSLVPELLESLLQELEKVNETPELRAVLLSTIGPSFSTGGDLLGFKQNIDSLKDYALKLVGLLNQVILAMIDLPIPIVTAVQGQVTGGSIGLLLASDIVFVSPQATITPYYSVVGFCPDGGWTALLPGLIGKKRAVEILTLNRTILAEEAVAWGIASRIVADHNIQAETRAAADKIAGMKAGSIRLMKRLIWAERDAVARKLEKERQYFVEQIDSSEARDGFANFLEGIKDNHTGQRAAG